MPLEIRQIGIRMQVGDGPARAAHDGDVLLLAGASGEDRARIVEECTRAVLAALARQARR